MQRIQHIKRSIQSIEIRSLQTVQGAISKKYHSNNRDIHAYSSIIQAYLEPYVTVINSEIWHMYNSGLLRSLPYVELNNAYL